ncbi:MAG: response regulator, partial [Campylobacterales bacterium]
MAATKETINDQLRRPDAGGTNGAGSHNSLTSVLLLDDEPDILASLAEGLKSRFGLIETAGDTVAANELLVRCHFDLIISDIRLPGTSGLEWIRELREQGDTTPVIFMTADADLQTAIQALRLGASDFILKPFKLGQMDTAVVRCLENQRIHRENYVLKRQVDHLYDSHGIVGSSDIMRNICDLIKRVAPM